jgi:hypothetical protein
MGTPTGFKKNLAGETQNLLKQLINNRTQVQRIKKNAYNRIYTSVISVL